MFVRLFVLFALCTIQKSICPRNIVVLLDPIGPHGRALKCYSPNGMRFTTPLLPGLARTFISRVTTHSDQCPKKRGRLNTQTKKQCLHCYDMRMRMRT